MRSLYLLLLLIYFPTYLFCQQFDNGFSFYLPPDDSTAQEFLPHFPAISIGAHDFVTVDSEGHFSISDKRIRFFGTNVTTGAAFPTKSKAPFIAGRLRKMGYNLVRFHHMDNGWSVQSLFESGQDTRHLNPETLDRFENMIFHLKENGIYANINLHVSRTVREQDGIAGADSIPDFGKGVSLFDPQFLVLHKEFARQLLTHVNPYTGLALVDDPVMAMVEITNENSLYRMWRSDQLRHFEEGGKLTRRHDHMLTQHWNDFLTAKYTDTEALRTAWNIGTRPPGSGELVKDGGFENDPISSHWVLEQHNNAVANMSLDTTDAFMGSQIARVDVTKVSGTNWHIQWKQINLSLKKDSLYTVRFAAKSNSPKQINIVFQKNSNPYTVYYSTSARLDTEWKTFQFSMVSPATVTNDVKLSFSLGGATGIYWFDEIHMYPSEIQGLAENESLESGNVKRILYSQSVNYSDARVKDMSAFINGRQNDYYDQMAAFLKDTLGVRVPLNSTNWNVGPADLAVQSRLDYMDNHSYWQHPRFPNNPWDPYDWSIDNTAMVHDDNGGTIDRLMAGVPFEGKPFTISEYNHPFPNHYQSEGVLFLTAYSAFHDVDGFMFFNYSNIHDDWETDEIDGFFSHHRNTAMMSLMPSCAKAFREGLIQPALETVLLNFAEEDILLLPKKDGRDWNGPNVFPTKIALEHGVKSHSFSSTTPFNPTSLPPEPANPYTTDTEEIIWDTQGLLKVATPHFIAGTGFLHEFNNTEIGDLTLVDGSDFGTFTWVSLTDSALQSSQRSLFTLSTRTQNTGMIWGGTTTVHNDWGSSPTEMQPIDLMVELFVKADTLSVHPLNERGKKTGLATLYTPIGNNTFRISFDQEVDKTVWYGIEKHGSGTNDTSKTQIGGIFELRQNYPNPFDHQTMIKFQLPEPSEVSLKAYNLHGQLIEEMFNGQKPRGIHKFEWNTTHHAAGTYFIHLQANGFSKTRKCVLVR